MSALYTESIEFHVLSATWNCLSVGKPYDFLKILYIFDTLRPFSADSTSKDKVGCTCPLYWKNLEVFKFRNSGNALASLRHSTLEIAHACNGTQGTKRWGWSTNSSIIKKSRKGLSNKAREGLSKVKQHHILDSALLHPIKPTQSSSISNRLLPLMLNSYLGLPYVEITFILSIHLPWFFANFVSECVFIHRLLSLTVYDIDFQRL